MHLYRILIIGIAVIFLSKTFADNIPKDSSGMVNIIDSSANEKINTNLQDPERMYLIATEFSLPIRGVYTLTMERTIKHSKTWGITGVIETDNNNGSGLSFYAVYLGLNFYSKKAFKGLFFAPNIGYKYFINESSKITVNLHSGYKWELPHSLLIGFGFGPGISGDITRKKGEKKIGMDFFGGAYLGKSFGNYQGKENKSVLKK